MVSTNKKTLQLSLAVLLLVLPAYLSLGSAVQAQAVTETAQLPARIAEGRSDQETAVNPVTPVATTAADEATNEAMRQMLRRIEDLERRIRELEAKESQTTARSSGAAMTAEIAETAAPPVTNAAAIQIGNGQGQGGHASHQDLPTGTPRLQIQGFADVNLRATDEKGRNNSFSLGQLDLFLTSRLSEKFSVLSELILDAGEDNAFTFEIHRLLLKYTHNDYFTMSAGRYHTGIGFYNTAYHHGSFFQTTANRPFLFAFESRGGILPLHNVGLSIGGRIPSAPLGLRYVAEIGNGRASRSPLARPVQSAADENNGKSFNLGLFARPSQVPGLQTGFSVYRDQLTPTGAPKVGQTIMAGHLIYQNARTELLNELIVFRHATAGRTFYIPGFYSQVSRRFENIRPFFRYQYINVPSDDPIYSTVGRRNGPSLGFRYDLTDFANFKAQYDRTARRRLSTLNELILQLAFTF